MQLRDWANKGESLPVYPLLALLWAIVLLPPIVRGRAQRRAEFVDFDRVRLRFVGASNPAFHEPDDMATGPTRRTAAQRRRRVLAVIGTGIAATLVVAMIAGTRVAWGVHLLVYDILIGYVALLARARDRRPSRPVVAPPLPQAAGRDPEPVGQLVLQAASR